MWNIKLDNFYPSVFFGNQNKILDNSEEIKVKISIDHIIEKKANLKHIC